MLKPIKIVSLLALAVFAAALCLPAGYAQAQERSISSKPRGAYKVAPFRGVGGYSTTLSEIWGEPKMPPAPKDFGPHFDYPADSLNGPPNRDPYPN
jgi:hypothetical protein